MNLRLMERLSLLYLSSLVPTISWVCVLGQDPCADTPFMVQNWRIFLINNPFLSLLAVCVWVWVYLDWGLMTLASLVYRLLISIHTNEVNLPWQRVRDSIHRVPMRVSFWSTWMVVEGMRGSMYQVIINVVIKLYKSCLLQWEAQDMPSW